MSDDLLDMSFVDDLDLNEVESDIEDSVPKGLRFGFIGAGQAGCNLVSLLRDKKGYRRTLFFNTTHKDIESVPEAYRIVPAGYDGAGKDRNVGRNAASSARGELTQSMTKYFKKLDYIFVCTSTAGGSGSGATPELAATAREYMVNYVGLSEEEASKHVGVIAMLPRKSEGGAAHNNTAKFIEEILADKNIKPLFLVDNERVTTQVRDGIGRFDKTNNVIAQMFDIFNTISGMSSNLMTFDPKDYASILQSGLLTSGLNTVRRYERDDDIARAIRLNLTSTVLVEGFEIRGATHAAIIVTGSEDILNSIPESALNAARTTLLGMMGGSNPVLHTGVYPSNAPEVSVLTIVGGFDFPKARLESLKARLQ